MPPAIDMVEYDEDESGNSLFFIDGQYLGTKKSKIYLTYQVEKCGKLCWKKATCKILTWTMTSASCSVSAKTMEKIMDTAVGDLYIVVENAIGKDQEVVE